jgi:probable HAF family extracellular repeat protein
MTDLGTFGESCYTAALNNHNEIVGASGDRPSGFPNRAFVWRDGSMIDLGMPGGESSNASDINEHGHIVGWAGNHGMLWTHSSD